jgi:CheY-like chemotaxis protein
VEILLVEDNPGDERLTREALKEGKVYSNLHWVKDGVEAMEFLRRQGKHRSVPRPDIILLDLNLPKRDGREVLHDIKNDADLKRIPVVVLTTSKAEGGRPAHVQPARQLLRHQARRPGEVHRGGEVDRCLLAYGR